MGSRALQSIDYISEWINYIIYLNLILKMSFRENDKKPGVDTINEYLKIFL